MSFLRALVWKTQTEIITWLRSRTQIINLKSFSLKTYLSRSLMSPASSRTSAAIQKATFSLVSRRVLSSFWSLQESPLFGGKRGKVEIRGRIFGRTSWKFHSKSVLLKSQNLHLYWKFRKLKYLKKNVYFRLVASGRELGVIITGPLNRSGGSSAK